MFARDNRIIRRYAAQSPEHMYHALVFAITSAQTRLAENVAATEFIRSIGSGIESLEYASLPVAVRSRCGTGLNVTKVRYLQHAWRNRREWYQVMSDSDAVTWWHYLLDHAQGLGLVKAAFAVQLTRGELGCLDTHNARRFGVDPKIVTAKKQSATAREAYLEAQSLMTSGDWWDTWCNYVAERYSNIYQSGDEVSALHASAIIG